MAWTKRDIVKQAFAEIGRSEYDFDASPEDTQHALRVLDSMAATWAMQGLRIGYAGGDGFGDIDASVEVPEFAHEALYLSLAVRIAPSFGKSASPDTKAAAKEARNGVLSRLINLRPRVISGYAGSGASRPNLPVPDDPLKLGTDGNLYLGEA